MLKDKGFISKVVIGALVCCFSFLSFSNAQNEISSPYSHFGIGIISNSTNGVLSSMGGVSYAMQSNSYINYRNPASYAVFDSLSFVGDISFGVNIITLKTKDVSQQGSTGNLHYIAIGLPITRHWRTSVGVLPFSERGFTVTTSNYITGPDNTSFKFNDAGTVNYVYGGTGGMRQLYWGNAFKICKGLSIGLNVSYIWGTLASLRYEEFEEANLYNYSIDQRDNADGIYLQGGLQYMADINEKHRIGIGVVYENSAYIWVKRNLVAFQYTNAYSSVVTYDTAYYESGTKGNMKIPQSVGLGLSYTYKQKMTFATDVTWQNWKNYRLMGAADSLKDNFIVALGLQFIPDPTSGKFGKNIALRLGGKFQTGYIQLRNTPISDFSVSIGLGLPFKTYSSRCSINLMFEYGQFGTTKNGLIRQEYFKFGLNVILVERWYQRVKLD